MKDEQKKKLENEKRKNEIGEMMKRNQERMNQSASDKDKQRFERFVLENEAKKNYVSPKKSK